MPRDYKSHRGERNMSSKLKGSDIRRIRALYETGKYTQKELGLRFGVSGSTINGIVRRTAWKHIK